MLTGRVPLQFSTAATTGADDIVILPMKEEMVRKAARIHRDALPDSRTAIMGERYVVAFIDWFRQPDHGGIALVAVEIDGEVVGYAIGAPLGYPRELSRHLFWISAGAVIARPWLFFRKQFRDGMLDRFRLVFSGSSPQQEVPVLPAPTMSLVAIGVASTARGKKIGLRLVRAFERRARELQMTSLRLSTRSDNAVACRLYEGCGWRAFSASDEMKYYFRIFAEQSAPNR
jgi:ribosomal protein S18 acetylase RimI-like enzyme